MMLKKALASNQFEQINYKDHSLAGWIKKGLLGVSTTKSQIKSSSIDYHILGLEKLVKESPTINKLRILSPQLDHNNPLYLYIIKKLTNFYKNIQKGRLIYGSRYEKLS